MPLSVLVFRHHSPRSLGRELEAVQDRDDGDFTPRHQQQVLDGHRVDLTAVGHWLARGRRSELERNLSNRGFCKHASVHPKGAAGNVSQSKPNRVVGRRRIAGFYSKFKRGSVISAWLGNRRFECRPTLDLRGGDGTGCDFAGATESGHEGQKDAPHPRRSGSGRQANLDRKHPLTSPWRLTTWIHGVDRALRRVLPLVRAASKQGRQAPAESANLANS